MYNNLEFQKTYITTTTSSSIFTGRGTLHGVCVNTTATGTITLIDGTSPFAVLQASILPGTYVEHVVIANSLTISTTGSPDITIKWVKA